MEKLYSIKELSEYLKVHQGSIRRWIASGKLKSSRIGGAIRITENQLQEFIEKGGKNHGYL